MSWYIAAFIVGAIFVGAVRFRMMRLEDERVVLNEITRKGPINTLDLSKMIDVPTFRVHMAVERLIKYGYIGRRSEPGGAERRGWPRHIVYRMDRIGGDK